MAAKNDKPAALTPRETEILIAAFVSLEDNKVDMQKLVKYSGFANANSARANWAPLKKRILEMAGEDGLTIPLQRSNKRKTKADAAEGEGEASPVAPVKKPRAPKKAQNDETKAPAAAKKRAAPKKKVQIAEEEDIDPLEGNGEQQDEGEQDEATETI
ncbi:hypothetical protein E8E14_010143 [Neopestalotiopsis sp. 37M]|nr:hypothetical protein E8E14_010143 [Neopestalotiopsis sp. 37M]